MNHGLPNEILFTPALLVPHARITSAISNRIKRKSDLMRNSVLSRTDEYSADRAYVCSNPVLAGGRVTTRLGVARPLQVEVVEDNVSENLVGS